MSTLALLLLLAIAGDPRGDAALAARTFAAAHEGARLLAAPSGALYHASGFAAPRRAADDEENARRFLAAEGSAFGIDSGSALQVERLSAAPGADGAARFRRLVQGRPVFGADVAVGWRADGAITVVNAAPAPPASAARGEAAISEEEARRTALAAAPGSPGSSSVELGWIASGDALVPAYRVVHDTRAPLGAWASYVDATSGALLWHVSRQVRAAPCPSCTTPPCICSYLVSPLAPPPAGGAAVNDPGTFALRGLPAAGGTPSPGARLDGQRTLVFNCAGRDVAGDITGSDLSACVDHFALADATGSFLAAPDATQIDPKDAFAEQSAYFHIDDHSRFLDALSPTFGARTPSGGIGRIAGYVNALAGGGAFDNAFFQSGGGPAGTSGVMVYGQGSLVDLSYDAEVVYHELTHAAVDVTASFEDFIDPSSGADGDPTALNEGTADTFAFAHVADALARAGLPIDSASCLSRYFGAELGLDCLRRADNQKTCRGNGPNDGRNPGRDGEPHDDGEIWTGFTWSLLEGAHDADPGGANGWRQAMASAMFKALEASGPRPTYSGYASTVVAKVRDAVAAGTLPQAAADFAACTYAQRDLDGCDDRSVALFSGETAVPFFIGVNGQGVRGRTPASQQYFVDVPCGTRELHVQAGDSNGTGRILVRYGQPVTIRDLSVEAGVFDWRIDGERPDVVFTVGKGCAGCNVCGGQRTPFGPGRWYFLASGGPVDAGGNINAAQLGVSLRMADGSAAPARPVHVIAQDGVNVCTWGGGAAPAQPANVIAAAPPPLACAPPGPPNPATLSCDVSTANAGCGCGASGPADGALLALALLALRTVLRGPSPRPSPR